MGIRSVADVNVGILLSGGLDSGSIVASLGTQKVTNISNFSVAFSERGYDESGLAGQVSRQYGYQHYKISVPKETLFAGLREASWFQDEPLAHGNDYHMLCISRYAKSRVRVLLSGEGADETLAGYVRYQFLRYANCLSMAAPVLGFAGKFAHPSTRMSKLGRFARLQGLHEKVLFNSCNTFPWDLAQIGFEGNISLDYRKSVLADAHIIYPRDLLRQVMYYDQHTFLTSLLDRNDRMTMAASIECRVPFLDYRLVEWLGAVPRRTLLCGVQGKPLARKAFAPRLPEGVRRHRKWGFGVPWHLYLREKGPFREFMLSLPDMKPVKDGPFNRRNLEKALIDYQAGDEANAPLIQELMAVVIWHTAFFT